MENITLEDIESAYLRLKRAIYYENNILLHLKMKLAEFENDKKFLYQNIRENFFKNFKKELDMFSLGKKSEYFNNLFLEIKYKKVIKKLNEKVDKNIYKIIEENLEKLEDTKKKEKLFSRLNKKIEEDFDKNKISYNYFIDCPIELHILSVLWIMKIGYKLDLQLDRNKNVYSYGYRLDIKKEKLNNIDKDDKEIIRGKSIFKRYYKQYQSWKSKGIKEVDYIRKKNENAVILSLDIKRFFYYINRKKLKMKIKEIDEEILKSTLTEMIFNINEEYAKKLKNEFKKNKIDFCDMIKNENTILPIGLYSSNILANIYLKELDDFILEKTSPNYYGRYVDDIFLVYEEYNLENTKNSKNYIFNKLKKVINKKTFNFIKDKNIIFNIDKLKLLILEKNKGRGKILELEESILKKASTFAFLPNEKEIRKIYKKISISSNDEEKEKKYNVSVYLSKLLTIFSYLEKKKDFSSLKEDVSEILYFFEDENLIRYYIYYEKIFLILVINKDIKGIEKFYKKVIEYFSNFFLDQNEKYNIEEYLNDSLCFALSLNPSLIFKLELDNINLSEKVEKIIASNLFKHNLISFPLLNYCNDVNKITFFGEPSIDIIKKINLNLEKVKLSPRFLHFSEFNSFYLKKIITNSYNEEMLELSKKRKELYEKSRENFALNFLKFNSNQYIFKENIKCILEKKNLNFYKINSTKNKNYRKIKIGVASVGIKENLEENILKSNSSYFEKEELIKILNLAKENNINILVFPEISIPYEWITLLNKFSRENQMVITGGFIHLFNQNMEYNLKKIENIFNFLFTILPFETKKYKTSFITIRLKNYYSPMEENIINGHFYSVPNSDKKYDIFSWEGVYFSNFNCFELSDIEGRSKLKNYIDLLIASVYNKDINYFENILESTCRDLHVFVVQSNTSIYGNCEILQPSSKDNMVLASIKGGKNNNLLIEEIDIESLRNFQLQKYYLQKREINVYKPTPSGMNIKIVNLRKENKLDKYFEEIEEK